MTALQKSEIHTFTPYNMNSIVKSCSWCH